MKNANILMGGVVIGFAAAEAPHNGDKACVGCLFERARSFDCMRAGNAALAAGQPDCEERAQNGNTYIYVEADPRQLAIQEADGA